MKNLAKKTSFAILFIYLTGCASAPFTVKSEPDNVEVFVLPEDSKEQKSLGMTPVTKTKKELTELLDGEIASGSMINLLLKKEGYLDKEVWIPASAGGDLGIDISVKMLEAEKNTTNELNTANEIIDKLFLAQSFARTQQFERALIEIDKVLAKFPDFDRALTMKGAVLYGQGQLENSLNAYEMALDVNPELRTAIDMSAKIRKKLGIKARELSSQNVKEKE